MAKDPTCEERILDQLNSRISQFGAMADLAGAYDEASLGEVLEDAATRELYEEIKPDGFEEDRGRRYDELREAAWQRIHETPLDVSSYRTFRVDLSTGGPGDWLEVQCSGSTPAYEGGDDTYEVERITYHFNDWFDHAERALEGRDYVVAFAFVGEVVPELAG